MSSLSLGTTRQKNPTEEEEGRGGGGGRENEGEKVFSDLPSAAPPSSSSSAPLFSPSFASPSPLSTTFLPPASSSSLSRPFQELYLTGYGKQFGEKITYSAGVSYAAGLSLGGFYGVCVGLRRGGSTPRLRFNALLNACSQHAPHTAAQLGTLTLFYCCFSNLLGMFREDHPTNATISGALAGCLYKSLASWKVKAAYTLTSALGFTAIDQYLRKYV